MKCKIGEIRRSKGITQRFLAEKAEVPYQRLSDWENDRSYPRIDKAIRIAGILEVSLNKLYEGD